MNYEKIGEEYVGLNDDGSVGLRYLKVPSRFRASAFNVRRVHQNTGEFDAFMGARVERDRALDYVGRHRSIKLSVTHDFHTPIRLIPKNMWDFLQIPTFVVLREGPSNHEGRGSVYYADDPNWAPKPFFQIDCYLDRDDFDEIWRDIGERPNAEIDVEVICDLYREETEIKFNEPEHTDHLYYAPGDHSLADYRPFPVHSASVTISDPKPIDPPIPDLEEGPPRPKERPSLREQLAQQSDDVRNAMKWIAFLLTVIAGTVMFREF